MPRDKDQIKWLSKPEDHDYPAAESYLGLLFGNTIATELVHKLHDEKIVFFKAKDLFRASRLSMLDESNSHVKKNLKKIEEGKELSPLLIVRDSENSSIIIADGYHRMCAVYTHDEDILIPCQITTKIKTNENR